MDGMRRISNRDFAVDVNGCPHCGSQYAVNNHPHADSYHLDRKQTDRKHGGTVITEVEG